MLTEENKIKIIDLYKNGLSSLKIAKIFNCNKTTILKTLKIRGINRRPLSIAKRKYFFNENYFEKIDTEEKAYFLGLLSADGCNYNGKSVTIALQENDIDILNRFKKCIEWTGNLYFLNQNNKNSKWKNLYKIYLHSKKISSDLAKFGCVSNKTINLKWPQLLDNKYYNHFIRGYFDGNGHVSKPETLSSKVTIFSTSSFVQSLKQIIQSNLKINILIETPKRYLKNHSLLVINGRNQLLQFLDWMYNDASIFLERKFKRYYELKFRKVNNKGRKYFNNQLTIKTNKNYEPNII